MCARSRKAATVTKVSLNLAQNERRARTFEQNYLVSFNPAPFLGFHDEAPAVQSALLTWKQYWNLETRPRGSLVELPENGSSRD